MGKDNLKSGEGLNREQRKIADYLGKVRFRKQLFGGVSERDVWKKIGELNEMFDQALVAERARYDALLEQQRAGLEIRKGED